MARNRNQEPSAQRRNDAAADNDTGRGDRSVTREKEPSTPAQEWGQRAATGKQIESGGKSSRPRPEQGA